MKVQTVNAPLTRPASSPRAVSASPSAASPGQARNGGRIRVLLADDHPVVRKGLVACLENRPNLELVGEAVDGRDAVRKARELAPDVLLLDINMPHMSGLVVTETLRKELPKCKVLMLSSPTASEYVLRILQSGAQGYILKDAAPDEMVKAIEMVEGGETYFSAEVARAALDQFMHRGEKGSELAQLTNREREVLTQIAEGLSNKEIACRLNIGTRTVETHRERLMEKLDIHSVAGLTRFAISKGIISLPELSLA